MPSGFMHFTKEDAVAHSKREELPNDSQADNVHSDCE